MKTADKLFARKHYRGGSLPPDAMLPKYSRASMARELKVDSIEYLCPADLPEAIGIKFHHLCMACMNGDYPMKDGRELHQIAMAKYNGSHSSR